MAIIILERAKIRVPLFVKKVAYDDNNNRYEAIAPPPHFALHFKSCKANAMTDLAFVMFHDTNVHRTFLTWSRHRKRTFYALYRITGDLGQDWDKTVGRGEKKRYFSLRKGKKTYFCIASEMP